MSISRVQPGVPAGGQFSASLHPEADISLASASGLTVLPARPARWPTI
ncbi:hypothetical protein [Arthrobacter sp. CAN_C5]|nr:hypothetical protein [Arthrobacter sp. CAN_C5]MBP2215998.1 hypothetical protein [Arthrobacter sp. CAN_C5]